MVWNPDTKIAALGHAASVHAVNRNNIDSRDCPLQIAIPKSNLLAVSILCNGSSSTLSQALVLCLQRLLFLLHLADALHELLQLFALSHKLLHQSVVTILHIVHFLFFVIAIIDIVIVIVSMAD